MPGKILSINKLDLRARDVICIRVGPGAKPGAVWRAIRRSASVQQLIMDDLKAAFIIVPHDFKVDHLRQSEDGKLTVVKDSPDDGTVPADSPTYRKKRQAAHAASPTRSVTFQPGVCRKCGCTDLDCTGCVKRTGFPCRWANADHTLCSACP